MKRQHVFAASALTLLIIIIVSGGWLQHLIAPAAAQTNLRLSYEYRLLTLDGEEPVLLDAEAELAVRPPMRRASGVINDPGRSSEEYTFRSVAKRHAGLGALNVLSRDGWEVVNMTKASDGKLTVLLKRPR